MKLKILLLVILLALMPQASATIFINQTSGTTSQVLDYPHTMGQNFTTPSYANASQYKLNYIEITGQRNSPGTQLIYVTISNNTYTYPNATLLLGFPFPTYPQMVTFNDVYLESGRSDYNFTISLPAGAAQTNIVFAGAGNPYSGGNLWLDQILIPNSDFTFNMSLSPHDNVGNWTFNQGSGNYANDSSGFNNNGTIFDITTGTVTWTTNLNNGSVNGTALQFGGVSGIVNVSNNASLNASQISISKWIKSSDTKALQFIMGHGNTGLQGWFNSLLNGNIIDFTVANGVSSGTATNTYDTGKWAHVVDVYNGSFLTVYVNGVPGTSVAFSGSIDYTGLDNTTFGEIEGAGMTAARYYNGTLDEVKIYNYGLNQSQVTTLYQQFQPVPAYPVGGIVLSAVYPPLQTSVTFSWHDTIYIADELQVAEDSAFNIMVHDAFYSTDSATVNLNAGKTYYWRVKQYNSTTGLFGVTSPTQIFSISSAPTVAASGASIQGIVYEIINGVQTPISGSIVYLSNSSTSMTFITSSNGYFLFQNLAPSSTYTIYATNAPVYNPSTAVFVTTGTVSETVTNNILLTRFFSPFVPNYVYEKFIVRNLFDTKFPGVTVNVYEDGNLLPTFTKSTDYAGQAVFQLIKDTYYRVEFSGGGLSSTITIFIYGKEEEYEVLVISGTPSSNVTTSQVFANLTYSAVNATFTNLTLIYNDGSLSTSRVNFFVFNNTGGTTTLLSYQTFLSGNNSFTAGFPVNSGEGNSYIWGYNATTQYGFQEGAKAITFPKSVPLGGLSSTVKNWIGIILLVILVSMFSVRNIKLGAVVVPIMAWVLFFWGWMSTNPLLIAVVTVLGVLVYMRKSEIKTEV